LPLTAVQLLVELKTPDRPLGKTFQNRLEAGVSCEPDEMAQNGPRRSGLVFKIALRQASRASPTKWRKMVQGGQETSPIIFVNFGRKIAVLSRQTRIRKSGNERGAEIDGPQI
jgi:hypothetical protein